MRGEIHHLYFVTLFKTVDLMLKELKASADEKG